MDTIKTPKSTISMREWRKNNPDKYKQALVRQHEQRTKESRQEYHLQRNYGISLAEKYQMLANQEGKCKICYRALENSRITHVDHCHTTGKIRGILCANCNGKLGWYELFKSNIEDYLNGTP